MFGCKLDFLLVFNFLAIQNLKVAALQNTSL